MKSIEKKYILNQKEFSVISAGFGITQVYGLGAINKAADSKEICLALHNMYVNELIDNKNEEGFETDKELADVLKGIREAAYLIRGCKQDKTDTLCCYIGNICSIIEINDNYPDKVIAYPANWEDAKTEILDMFDDAAGSIELLDIKSKAVKASREFEAKSEDIENVLEQMYKEVTQ